AELLELLQTLRDRMELVRGQVIRERLAAKLQQRALELVEPALRAHAVELIPAHLIVPIRPVRVGQARAASRCGCRRSTSPASNGAPMVRARATAVRAWRSARGRSLTASASMARKRSTGPQHDEYAITT